MRNYFKVMNNGGFFFFDDASDADMRRAREEALEAAGGVLRRVHVFRFIGAPIREIGEFYDEVKVNEA